MSYEVLIMLLFLGLGIIFVLQGLPGLLSSEMTISSKYGRRTHYTGNKAVALGFGTTAFGLLIILNGIFIVATKISTKSPLWMLGFFLGIGIYLVSWIISWFVSGTAVRERRKSLWW